MHFTSMTTHYTDLLENKAADKVTTTVMFGYTSMHGVEGNTN